jgi:sarcosine oxidase subunit gamma
LAGQLDGGGRAGADGKRLLKLGEARGWSLVQVAGFPSTMSEVERLLRPILVAIPPHQIGTAVTADDRLLMRTGPEQLWIIGPDGDDAGERAYGAIAAELGAVTPLSHSRTRIVIEGERARAVLAKSVPVDVDPEGFAVGRFALTGIHHTPVLLHRMARERYDIWAMRSFALTVWQWLTDVAWEYGYETASFSHKEQ